MSNINTSIGGAGYYQLNQQSGSANNSTGNLGRSPANVGTLASALQGVTANTNTQSPSGAYLLDLSPQAQLYLASNGQQNASSSSTLSGSQSFLLKPDQKQTIADIIARYKDAPFTQETFNQLQDDLEKEGLGAQQLAMIDNAKSFNPTQILVDALAGRSSSFSGTASTQSQQGKIDNFMQDIVKQWRAISTTADEVPSDAVTAAGGSDAS
jgi:hypothetical protein